jgi:RNA polymerase sigma factor (sigma-70 family)
MLARNAFSRGSSDQVGPSDHQLVAAIRRGDDRAFECLYERYRRRIQAYVAGMCKDHARAEDITQEVFVSALRRMRETERPIAFKPWIYEIAKNACIDQHRRASRAEEVSLQADDGLAPADYGRLVGSEPTPDAAVAVKQELEDLCGAFGGLSEAHHDILVMRELEGLSYREIGARMGMTRPAVESTLFRARRRLTEEYDDLVSGQRCVRIQAIIGIAGEAGGKAGTRDTRRLARHIAHCQTCRREAIAAGLDTAALVPPRRSSVAARVAGLLPFPLLGRRAAGGGSGRGDGWVAQLGSVADHIGPGWAKAATAAAVLLAGAGAGVDVASDPGAPAPRASAVRAHDAGAPGGGGGAAAPGAATMRATGTVAASRLTGPGRGAAAGATRGLGSRGTTAGGGGPLGTSPAAAAGSGTPGAGDSSPGGVGSGQGTPELRLADSPGATVQHADSHVAGAVSDAAGTVSGAVGPVSDVAGAVSDVAGTVSGAAGTVSDVVAGAEGAASGAVGAVENAAGSLDGAAAGLGDAVTPTAP